MNKFPKSSCFNFQYKKRKKYYQRKWQKKFDYYPKYQKKVDIDNSNSNNISKSSKKTYSNSNSILESPKKVKYEQKFYTQYKK